VARLKVDPELRRQLDAARGDADLVQAVLSLRPPGAAGSAPSPEETEAMVARLLARVRQETGLGPRDYNVFRHLGAFVVAGSARFVRALMAQAEIASAQANRPGARLADARERPEPRS
jgi:hypothetical protein